MKLLILFLLLVNSAGLFCQSVRNEVLASCGGSSDESGISVSWTMGETIINEYSLPGYALSQGFQQALLSVAAKSEKLPDEIDIKAYPNPVLNSLAIQIVRAPSSYHWSVKVYDNKGEVVIQRETKEDITEIYFTSLPPGSYLVQINHQGNYKTFNIIKQ